MLVWSTAGRGAPVALQGAGGDSADFRVDGLEVATCSHHVVQIWRAEGAGKVAEFGTPSKDEGCWALFSPEGANVLRGSRDGSAQVWKRDGTGQAVTLRDVGGIAANGDMILTGVRGFLSHALDARGRPLTEVRGVVFSPDGTRILASARDGIARIMNVDGRGPSIELNRSGRPVRPVAFSADGKNVAAGGDDGVVHVWNADGSGGVELRPSSGAGFAVDSVAFSRDAKRIVAGFSNGIVNIWESGETGPPVAMTGHGGRVTLVAFSPDGQRLLSAADDLHPKGNGTPGTFGDGTALVWTLDARALLWRQTHVCLTPEERSSLLGEAPDRAIVGARRCRETAQRCRVSFEACQAAVRDDAGAVP
jgi:WD40 repeat protein